MNFLTDKLMVHTRTKKNLSSIVRCSPFIMSTTFNIRLLNLTNPYCPPPLMITSCLSKGYVILTYFILSLISLISIVDIVRTLLYAGAHFLCLVLFLTLINYEDLFVKFG
jgi:hypothetical protein